MSITEAAKHGPGPVARTWCPEGARFGSRSCGKMGLGVV